MATVTVRELGKNFFHSSCPRLFRRILPAPPFSHKLWEWNECWFRGFVPDTYLLPSREYVPRSSRGEEEEEEEERKSGSLACDFEKREISLSLSLSLSPQLMRERERERIDRGEKCIRSREGGRVVPPFFFFLFSPSLFFFLIFQKANRLNR